MAYDSLRDRVVLFGGMQDKKLDAKVGAVLARADMVVAAPVSLPRSRNSEDLEALLREWGVAGATETLVAADAGDAVGRLAAVLEPRDSVLVTGSCFMVAEVMHRLGFRDLEETRTVRPAREAMAAAAGGANEADEERTGGGR